MKKMKIESKKYGSVETLLDDDDYELVIKYGKWQVTKNRNHIYVQKRINNKLVYLHRLILNFPKGYVDHINHDTLDNRKSNLRIATNSDNLRNGNLRINNKTGINGVYFDKSRNKYLASIKVNYKKIFIGRYNTLEEAREKIEEKRKEYWIS